MTRHCVVAFVNMDHKKLPKRAVKVREHTYETCVIEEVAELCDDEQNKANVEESACWDVIVNKPTQHRHPPEMSGQP